MALSDEQNAMLRLLASGEQGYADIAALLGQSEDEVRAKVVGALAQLQAEGKPAPDIPPPIAGGAKPAAEVAPPEPEPSAPAEEEPASEPVVAESVAPSDPVAAADPKAPKAAADDAPAPAQPKAAASPPPSHPPSSGGRTITLPSGRNAWILGGGILAAIAAIVVVILVASGGGGGGSSTASTESASTTAEEGKSENASSGSRAPTEAKLSAVDGSEAAGLVTFGRVKNKLALQVEATGLEPTVEGTDAYTVWLAQSSRKMLPLASTAVKGTGKGANAIAAEFEVPVEILAYLANGTFDQIAITKTQIKPLEASIKAAKKKKGTPAYTGEAVMRGTIVGPIVGIAKREEEKEKGE